MRKVTYGAACSLDGYITGPDGDMGWLRWSDDVNAIVSDYWRTIDTVLMGRKTYEFSVAAGSGSDPGSGIKTYVFSRTLKECPEGVELVSEDAAGFVSRLKRQPGKDICLMGGGELAGSLFEAGVIDEVGVNLHPVLLGAGVPMFLPLSRPIELELLDSRPLAQGCAYLIYRVTTLKE